jgi:hypothetical protein
MKSNTRTLVLLLSALYAVPAFAGPPFGCCFCTSQEAGNRALLCEALPSSDIVDFESECGAAGGNYFSCAAATSPDVCQAVFESRGVICPRTAPAPVMGSTATIVLAAVLVCLGIVGSETRRRRQTRH